MSRNKVPITAQIMFVKDNIILLLKRCNTGYEDGKYSFPGGHVEKAEEVTNAAIREAKEEIGVEINSNDISVVHVLNRRVGDDAYVDFIFKTSKWTGDIEIKEKDKCDEIIWADINNLPKNTLPFIKETLTRKSFYIPYNWEGEIKNDKKD